MPLKLTKILPLILLLTAGVALAETSSETKGSSGSQKINETFFFDDGIGSVTAVTEVFGRSQRVTGVIIELAGDVDPTSISKEIFQVDDRNVLSVKVSAVANMDAPEMVGKYVVIALDPEDEASVVFAPGSDNAPHVVIHQTKAINLVDGRTLEVGGKGIINTRVSNLIVDDFNTYIYEDPETGLELPYNIFLPKDYDEEKGPYPLVVFLHDAGVTGSDYKRTLKQGLGAISFASPEDQARHPSFVIAPQFPVALTNDASQASVYVDMIPRLIDHLKNMKYAIDTDRIYTTGQSGGCMASIALGVSHPDLFAATLCVAGQWDPTVTAPLADQPFWAIVSEDDAKAYPGMTAIMDVLEKNGASVTRGTLDAKASDEEMESAITAIREAGKGHTFFTSFVAGSVLEEGASPNPGAGHVNTWVYAYSIPAVRDWLFEQHR